MGGRDPPERSWDLRHPGPPDPVQGYYMSDSVDPSRDWNEEGTLYPYYGGTGRHPTRPRRRPPCGCPDATTVTCGRETSAGEDGVSL